MADKTVSTDVDNLLSAADNAAIRSLLEIETTTDPNAVIAAALVPYPTFDEADAALAYPKWPLRSGIYSPSSSEAFSIAEQASTALTSGTDFTVFLYGISLPDWTPASDVVIWTNENGNQGIRIVLKTSGALSVETGNGSWTSHATTETLSALSPYQSINLALVGDRDSVSSFYVNETPFDTVDFSATETDDLSGGAFKVLPSSEGYCLGYYGFLNITLNSTQVAIALRMPDWILRQDAGADAYVSAFSGGVDGWVNVRLTDTAPVNNIFGEDNTYRLVDTTATGTHQVRRNGLLTSGVLYRLKALVYIPSDNANVDRVSFRINGSNTISQINQLNQWVEVNQTFTASGSDLYIMMQDGSSASYTGNGTDQVYVKDIQVLGVGAVEMIDLTVSGTTKTDRIGSNDATRGLTSSDTL